VSRWLRADLVVFRSDSRRPQSRADRFGVTALANAFPGVALGEATHQALV
jgi:hypothetical protein